MFRWAGPRWMLPGTPGAKAGYVLSTFIAIVFLVRIWSASTSAGVKVLLTLLLLGIMVFNLVTLVLARGPYARAMLAAADRRDDNP